MKIYQIVILVTLSTAFTFCNNNSIETKQKVDYSASSNWASMPYSIKKQVDVFFVYPTLFGGIGRMNMDIASDTMRMLVQAVLLKQGSVFENTCNVYAPYYRQMAMDGLSMNEEERDKYFSIGMTDIEQAFDFYITNLNKGRPFILAGHSQGSETLINLMKDKFDKPELMNKLVASYLIGYSVTDDDLAQCSWLKIAESDDDIGVIITYNTQSESATNSPVLLRNANCVNPLNWKNTNKYAPKEMNSGAIFFKDNGEIDSIVPQFTDAWIGENGALIVGTPNIQIYSTSGFPEGVYHKYDYSFFFNNLMENVDARVNTYLDKN